MNKTVDRMGCILFGLLLIFFCLGLCGIVPMS